MVEKRYRSHADAYALAPELLGPLAARVRAEVELRSRPRTDSRAGGMKVTRK